MDEQHTAATDILLTDCWPELFRRFWQGRHADPQGRLSAGPTVQEGFKQYIASALLDSLLTADERREIWAKAEKLLVTINKRSDTQGRITSGRVDVLILELQLGIDEPVPRM